MLPQEKSNLTSLEWPLLVDGARDGCDRSLSEIINRLHGYLLLIANGQSQDRLQAKFGASDIVQNSLLDAYEGIGKFRGNTEAEMRAWLKSIVLHNLLDEHRRYASTHARSIEREQSLDAMSTLSAESDPGNGCLMKQDEESQKLSLAIEKLPLQQQKVIEARHRDDQSYRQIAENLGIAEASARKIWSRAIERLRDLLAEKD